MFGFLPADMIFFGKDLFQLTSLSLLLIKSNPKKYLTIKYHRKYILYKL
jgi:hypothetical protein